MNYQTLREELIRDEALRLKPYTDTKGKLTIGVGRNLTDRGLSIDETMILLDNDIKGAATDLDRALPWWRGMSEARQHVLINMCFNMGINRLGGFIKALAAMEKGDYNTAADEMQDSDWFKDVGGRAIRLVSLMRNGI